MLEFFIKRYFVSVAMLLVTYGCAQAEIYRWVDKSSMMHYGDLPDEEAISVERIKFRDIPEAEYAYLPYETRLAMQKFPVTLYLASNCNEPCQQARDLLIKRGIPFAEKNLVTKDDIDAFKLESGGDTVPMLKMGKSWLKYFEAEL